MLALGLTATGTRAAPAGGMLGTTGDLAGDVSRIEPVTHGWRRHCYWKHGHRHCYWGHHHGWKRYYGDYRHDGWQDYDWRRHRHWY